MNKFLRNLVFIFILAVLMLASFPGYASAQSSNSQPPAESSLAGFSTSADGTNMGTGLVEPTAEEAAWMNKNFPVIKKIRLNEIAFQRINAERAAKGQGQLSKAGLDIAPLGREAVFSSTADAGASATGTGDTGLPGSVDNSALPAFPPIRSQGSIASCTAWATTYYQYTYETNLARGRTASDGNNNNIFSPKWTYDFLNGGK